MNLFEEQCRKFNVDIQKRRARILLNEEDLLDIEDIENEAEKEEESPRGNEANAQPGGEDDASMPGVPKDATKEETDAQTAPEEPEDASAEPVEKISGIEVQQAKIATDLIKLEIPKEKRAEIVSRLPDSGIVSDLNAKKILSVLEMEIKPFLPTGAGKVEI